MILKKYLLKLLASVTAIDFYKQLKNTSVLSSVSFFIFSFAILGIVLDLELSFKTIPQIETQSFQSLEQIKNNYPEDLSISWDKETLNINRSELKLDYPDWLKLDKKSLPQYLAIYSSTDLNPESVSSQISNSSLLVFDRQQLFVSQLNGNYDALPLTEVPGFEKEFVINKNNLPEKVATWQNALAKLFSGSQKVLPFFLIPSFIILSLIGNFLDALLVFLLVRIFGRFSFKYIFKISLHVAVIAEIIARATALIYAHSNYPLFSISYWIIISFVLLNLKNSD
jgi:hypothetical protein